ncbi:NAD(P)H-hydrate dehydratase [Paucibacter sp. TC2R-5]|uniref:NAD(P)H-hydrate dehydratase n=1 Tax=Paucibacter sp. TC2R-5 TaxID=2893555 RepID=UPI0021E3D1E1|nr:NAD(P)H-hydrate dehydratase [Paucibacter sp. TC2R-5]MCV2357700.1 NAD(P)H-hydrate dehydratase [Paucibacter sp. TC2R-5]
MLIKLLPTPKSWPLYGAASSRSIEAAALAAAGPASSLMERAGLAAARLTLALAPTGSGPIWIVCGPGNNGGDGLVAARLLHRHGLKVQVSLLAASSAAPADAAAALAAARQAGVPINNSVLAPAGVRMALDALLGLGLNPDRAPNPEMAAAFKSLNALNALRASVLALDLPSGLQSDSGSVQGGLAVQAQHTLALLALKPGMFTAQGRTLCGQIWLDDLNNSADRPATPRPADALLLGADCLTNWQVQNSPRHGAHKGSQGDVLVVGGAAGMRGAARLAARAALAAGAGRVYVCMLGTQADDVDPQRPELMRFDSTHITATDAANADWLQKVIVGGCGGGQEIGAFLAALLTQARRLVLDADGLNAVAAQVSLRALLKKRQASGLATILTPHPLEAARLLGSSAAAVQADRLSAAQALADEFSCQVILKGSGSIIAGPQKRLAINSSGNAALATAGSGDVLAGWLGGLWAQQNDADPFDLACLACYWHGAAAEAQTAGPMRAADLVERMHALHRPAPTI